MTVPVVGDELPPWTMAHVDAARMKTMAAILRDPYTVHWDRDLNQTLGLGARVINQGPLNLGYIVNMLHAWAGPGSVRRLTVSFGPPVLDGDQVTARGRVTSLSPAPDPARAEVHVLLEVWLERDGEPVVSGSAVVVLSTLEEIK